MALTQGLQQRQSQNLAMTAELQQSLKMLQLSSIDLADMVYAELEKNPMLAADDGESVADAGSFSADTSKMDLTQTAQNRDLEKSSEVVDHDYGASWEDAGKGGNQKFENMDYDYEDVISDEKDLRELLCEQFFIDVADESKRKIGVYMMDYLDDAGYFIGKTEEIAENLGCDTEEVEEVLSSLQKLEPTGVFARNLQECLKIQLEEKNRLDPCMFTLLSNLELLAMRKFDILLRLCDVSEEDLEDMVLEIKALNPKPALGFGKKELTPTQPDVFVKRKDDGTFTVELNNAALPKVLANKKYYQEVVTKVKDKEEKKYIKSHFASANFLVRALEQRAETMIKTAAAIVKFQEEFFKYGIKYLKPLTLAQIAEEIEMHESTISRVTSNKYIQTPRGSFEMKYFFISGVSNSSGEVASTSVKETIKELIEAEDRDKPLSDDAITTMLKKRGINISRRTVMKYREAMGVASSYERKNSMSFALSH